MLQRTGIPYRVISLLWMVAMLAIAWGMDRFLEHQRELAAATFNHPRYSLLPSTVSMLILFALWFGLGWLALLKSGYSQLIWIAFLVVGVCFGLGYYALLFIPLVPVGNNVIRPIFQVSTLDMLRPTGMFIAVLGLLNLAMKFKSRLAA